MNTNWELKKISDICDFQNSKRIPLKSLDREKRQGEYPYYGASGIVDYIDDYVFDGKFLLISEDGENLRTRNTPIAFQAEGKFWVNNHAHILSEKEDGILDYLEYYFSVLNVNPYITGAVQPKLNKANLDAIEISVPPLNERLQINKILNSLKEKINLNNQINQTLESIAQAIFKSWFIDFEPVKAKIAAKLEGKDPEVAAMCAISGKTEAELEQMDKADFAVLKATAALFPDELMESELGEVPREWEVSTVGEKFQTVGGATPSTKNPEFWDNGQYHWTTPKDLSNLTDKVLLNTDRKITAAGLKKISSGLLPKNTVLMSSRAPVGYLALAKIEVAINQGYIAILPNKKYSAEYLIQWCEANMAEIKGRASGTTFQEISKKNFREINFLCPTEHILIVYARNVQTLYNQISSRVIENQNLIKIRDTLLPKLLSGEIDVSMLEGIEHGIS